MPSKISLFFECAAPWESGFDHHPGWLLKTRAISKQTSTQYKVCPGDRFALEEIGVGFLIIFHGINDFKVLQASAPWQEAWDSSKQFF